MLVFNKLPHFSAFLNIAIRYLLTNYSVFAHGSLSFKPSLEYSKLFKAAKNKCIPAKTYACEYAYIYNI